MILPLDAAFLRRISALALAVLASCPLGRAAEPASRAPAASVRATAAERDTITAAAPMALEAEGTGAHGQLVVAPELIGSEGGAELTYAITADPLHGRVGLAGGDEGTDIFRNKTSRQGYFAYRPQEGYAGEDSFVYTVRNLTTGLTFRNKVVIAVKPPPPVMLEKFEVGAARERSLNVREVALVTRPNTLVAAKVPSHEDFMLPTDRLLVPSPKVAYLLDGKSGPRNGTARLDRATGQLTYAPNPGFIGEERFGYYTVDENNAHLGVENVVTVSVEPIRRMKQVSVDRSRSREVLRGL